MLLRSGRIELPFGAPTDSPEGDTVCGLDNRKTGQFMQVLDRDGVDPAKVAVIEDTVFGVSARGAVGFRLVIGVDHGSGREALLDARTTIVVPDFAGLMTNRG